MSFNRPGSHRRILPRPGTSKHPPGLQIGDEVFESEDDLPYFSYAAPEDGKLKRLLIRAIEHATGQPRLKSMYLHHRENPRDGETFWQACIRYLDLTINVNDAGLAGFPRSGPVVVVANHPFGVLDGIVLSYLVCAVRPDFKILTNSVLYRAPELRPYLLPIDFAETREATRTNLDSRAEARALLQRGGVVVVFPGGTVSTARRPFGNAEDPDWKPFTARLIMGAKADVVPVYFAGQNGVWFQLASQMSQTLRVSLLFKEVADRIGTTITAQMGAPIPFADLQHLTDRQSLMAHLRQLTYGLKGQARPAKGRKR